MGQNGAVQDNQMVGSFGHVSVPASGLPPLTGDAAIAAKNLASCRGQETGTSAMLSFAHNRRRRVAVIRTLLIAAGATILVTTILLPKPQAGEISQRDGHGGRAMYCCTMAMAA